MNLAISCAFSPRFLVSSDFPEMTLLLQNSICWWNIKLELEGKNIPIYLG